jgi:hypothetical protein
MGVTRRAAIGVCAAMLAGAARPPVPPDAPARPNMLAVFRSTTIRMPLLRRRRPDPPPAMEERKGPHCIEADEIAAAAVIAPNAVDFVLRGGDRMRARLDGACAALDFYGGFYMNPGDDGRICAGRDVIRTRAGGECGIDRFRRLVPPKPPKP